jgi:hypothetical protein
MMKVYTVFIDEAAIEDIKNASRWYETKQKGLGLRFKKQVSLQITSLSKAPNSFSIRYKKVRCMLVKKFPFLVHFTVDDKKEVVTIFAVYHTSSNPEIWLNI